MSSPNYWREIPQRYRLEAGKCKNCGKHFYPPRLVCDACACREFETATLGNKGTLETFTVIRVAPSDFSDQAPYAIGIVKLDDGVCLLAQVVDIDPEKIETGMRVTMEFRKIKEAGDSGVIYYGHKAVPS